VHLLRPEMTRASGAYPHGCTGQLAPAAATLSIARH